MLFSAFKKKSKNLTIVKFIRRTSRNKMFAYKKNLKSTDPKVKLSITESPTKRRLSLIEKVREVFEFKNVWTLNGTVYCLFKKHKNVIDDFSDIEKIRFPERHKTLK